MNTLDAFAAAVFGVVRGELTADAVDRERDLTMRQLAVLLIVERERDAPHTVRGLAERLNVQKPVITRAVDALEKAGLLARRDDPNDRRSVHIVPTEAAKIFIRGIGGTVRSAAA